MMSKMLHKSKQCPEQNVGPTSRVTRLDSRPRDEQTQENGLWPRRVETLFL